MGTFLEEVTLENTTDRALADLGYIKDTEVRTLKVEAMPDTGAWTLVINEEVREKLGLGIEKEVHSTLADGTKAKYPLTKPVKIYWRDRDTTLPAVVVSGAKNVLLGALPLEAMDLIVDPVQQTLAGAHGDQAMHILYSACSVSTLQTEATVNVSPSGQY